MMVALQTLDLTVWSNLKLYNLLKTADHHSAIVYTYYSSSCGFHMKLLWPAYEWQNLALFSLYEQVLKHFNSVLIKPFPGPPEGSCTCECRELMRGRTPPTGWGSSTRPSARSWAWCTTTPSIGGSVGQPHPSLSGHSILMTWTLCDVWRLTMPYNKLCWYHDFL